MKSPKTTQNGEFVARELVLALAKCPEFVQGDVLNRTADHLERGGTFEDDYIAINQLRYAQAMRDKAVDKPL